MIIWYIIKMHFCIRFGPWLSGPCLLVLSNEGEIFQVARNSPVFYKKMSFSSVSSSFFLSYLTGLVHKKMNRLEDALDCFHKLQAILRNHPQVLYQIANLYPLFLWPICIQLINCNHRDTLLKSNPAKGLEIWFYWQSFQIRRLLG